LALIKSNSICCNWFAAIELAAKFFFQAPRAEHLLARRTFTPATFRARALKSEALKLNAAPSNFRRMSKQIEKASQ